MKNKEKQQERLKERLKAQGIMTRFSTPWAQGPANFDTVRTPNKSYDLIIQPLRAFRRAGEGPKNTLFGKFQLLSTPPSSRTFQELSKKSI